MATLISGRLSGTQVRVIQWANNWVSIEAPTLGQRDRIVAPTRLELTPAEVIQFRASMGSSNLGHFWALWSLNDNGRFVSLAEPRRRQVRRGDGTVYQK
jgi:hypothetical protein